LFYRDRLRAARYAALADAEGFSEICFAVEALGMRMLDQQAMLGNYKGKLVPLAANIGVMKTLANDYPGCFSQFHALYETLNKARNDAMHTGAYARHATYAAIELCIHLEEAVMTGQRVDSQEDSCPMKVKDYMVKQVVSLEGWHPVAYARKLMLMHSFSFLPVFVNGRWALLSELAIAKYLQVSLRGVLSPPLSARDARRNEKSRRLASPIHAAIDPNDPDFPVHCQPQILELCESPVELQGDEDINGIINRIDASKPTLWLVLEKPAPSEVTQLKRLQGVLTPFELM
jgi:hypothetical protein